MGNMHAVRRPLNCGWRLCEVALMEVQLMNLNGLALSVWKVETLLATLQKITHKSVLSDEDVKGLRCDPRVTIITISVGFPRDSSGFPRPVPNLGGRVGLFATHQTMRPDGLSAVGEQMLRTIRYFQQDRLGTTEQDVVSVSTGQSKELPEAIEDRGPHRPIHGWSPG